jgi:HTH-type transcriptional regulator, sugar sensing transcriptional regulator
MAHLDLTRFGFTPTEGLMYEVLLASGPGTGYALARAAGLARANAYSALSGLVAKGAARVNGGRPKQYRPEPPAGLIARISNDHGQALEQLSRELAAATVPGTPTVIEVDSARAVLQLITQNVARAARRVDLLAPADAYPLLAPALRRPVSAAVSVNLYSPVPVELDFARVDVVPETAGRWPGMPVISLVDDSALIGSRTGAEVHGHWSTAPAFVAAARLALEQLRAGP